MGGEIERLDRLEDGLRQTQDSILLMGKDIHSLTKSTESIATSMEVLAVLQQDLKVMEERYENRHIDLKHADEVIHSRIDKLVKKDEILVNQAKKGETAYNVLTQIAKWLGAGAVTLFLGLMAFLIQLKGSQ
jgi:hypothetical protein